MCAISINSYDWDWSELEGKRPKPSPLPHLRLWFIDENHFGTITARAADWNVEKSIFVIIFSLRPSIQLLRLLGTSRALSNFGISRFALFSRILPSVGSVVSGKDSFRGGRAISNSIRNRG